LVKHSMAGGLKGDPHQKLSVGGRRSAPNATTKSRSRRKNSVRSSTQKPENKKKGEQTTTRNQKTVVAGGGRGKGQGNCIKRKEQERSVLSEKKSPGLLQFRKPDTEDSTQYE